VDGGVISEITTMVIHVDTIGLFSVLPKRFSASLLINDSVLFQISKFSVDLNYLGGGVLSKSGTPSRT
jgi:hypothetical protein